MAIPQKFLLGRQPSGSDYMSGMLKPCDNKTTKKYTKDLEEVTRFSKLPVVEIDNTPLVGFRIVGSSSYHRETYFKIEHPLGFIFSIDTANMMDLIRNNDIIDVEFKNPLFFSDKMKLINCDSGLYASMLQKEADEKERRRLQTAIEPGTYFVSGKNNHKYHYFGRFHMFGLNGAYSAEIVDKTSLLHVMYNLNTNKFEITSTLRCNVKFITRKESGTKMPHVIGQDAVDFLNSRVQAYDFPTYDRGPLLFSIKPLQRTAVRAEIDDTVIHNTPLKGHVIHRNECDYFVIMAYAKTSGSTWNRTTIGYNVSAYPIVDGVIQAVKHELYTSVDVENYKIRVYKPE